MNVAKSSLTQEEDLLNKVQSSSEKNTLIQNLSVEARSFLKSIEKRTASSDLSS